MFHVKQIKGQKLSQNGFALTQGIYEPRADLWR
jgi:hypothetical protein